MSASGQERTSEHVSSMSALPSKVDVSALRSICRMQLGNVRRNPTRLVGHNNQALSGPIDCSDFPCGWPMQAGRPFSRNSLWVIPQRTQALESKSKRFPRAVRSGGIPALATRITAANRTSWHHVKWFSGPNRPRRCRQRITSPSYFTTDLTQRSHRVLMQRITDFTTTKRAWPLAAFPN
jgi:hypothetical protein